MSADASSLEVKLTHRFAGGFELDVAFATDARTLALFGPSGSGKSTIIAALAGTLRPRGGRVVVQGRTLFDSAQGVDLSPRERQVGLVLQEALLFPLLSVRENMLFGAPKRGGRLELSSVAELLEVGNLLDRMPRNLSGGERQRVALGRAILAEPRLLLCDEPFSALDAARRDRLVGILAGIRDELEIPMVLVTHRVREVMALAEDVVVLSAGRSTTQGSVGSLIDELSSGGAHVPNLLVGEVVGEGRVRVGDVEVFARVAEDLRGQRVRLSVDGERIALSSAEVAGSPRNQLQGKVVGLAQIDAGVRVDVEAGSIRLGAIITPTSVAEMSLTVGSPVWLVMKQTAVEVLSVEPAAGRGD